MLSQVFLGKMTGDLQQQMNHSSLDLFHILKTCLKMKELFPF